MTGLWTIAKDAIGFVGALTGTVPWFRDFKARMRLERIGQVDVGEGLAEIKADIRQTLEGWIAQPKASDFYWMAGGLLLVAASFLIGLIQSLAA